MAGGVHRAGAADRAPVRAGRATSSGHGLVAWAVGRATADQLLDDRRACRGRQSARDAASAVGGGVGRGRRAE